MNWHDIPRYGVNPEQLVSTLLQQHLWAFEADVERCRGQVKTEIESVIPLVGGIFGAHCDTASTAEETAKAHESLIGNLSVEAQRESEKLCECLQTSKTQAAQKLSAEHATVVQMLDAVAIAGNCAKATAQNTKSFISVATTESKASFGQRADKLDEHVKSGGQTVQTTRRRGPLGRGGPVSVNFLSPSNQCRVSHNLTC